MKLPKSQLLFELRELVLGEYLGEGVSRRTYRLTINPEYVIKISDAAYSWQNVNEWEVWWYAKGTVMEKWLAPCEMISPSGVYLIQRYAETVHIKELPKHLPRFLCDHKVENFGMIDGHVVARDYGTSISQIPNVTGRRKADWGPSGYDGVTV